MLQDNPSLKVGLINIIPGRIYKTDHNITLLNLSFSKEKVLLGINEWVSQLFFAEKISICELIKSVADKEAAHSDNKYNSTLIHCRSWSYNDTNCHILGIYGIARFIYDLIINEYSDYLN